MKKLLLVLWAVFALPPALAQGFSLALRLENRPLLEDWEIALQGTYSLELQPELTVGLRGYANVASVQGSGGPGPGVPGEGRGRGRPEDRGAVVGLGLSPYLEYARRLLDDPALQLGAYAGARADLSLSLPGYAFGFDIAPYAGVDLGWLLDEDWELISNLEARFYLVPPGPYLSSYLEFDFYGFQPATLYGGYSFYLDAPLSGSPSLGQGPYLGVFYPLLEGLSAQGEVGADGAWYAFVRLRLRF
ncbi:hypothetical protein [Calidithermus roseus]|uniref:MetA-pathway of phenol degradation n=1 Tax=Calidithermus roseus TaxID=1644118 RepID=A0A399F0F6_9DEIN|nr:hypothetical protein [Calidithermus roseus]RIH89460.1 hypothetical protein Mrose_00361 [Calidithermus roseus]